jgi:hypothetical protein
MLIRNDTYAPALVSALFRAYRAGEYNAARDHRRQFERH